MRKWILLLMVVTLLFSAPALAGRIEDMTAENTRIDQIISNKQAEIAQLIQLKMQNLGGIRELQALEVVEIPEAVVEIEE